MSPKYRRAIQPDYIVSRDEDIQPNKAAILRIANATTRPETALPYSPEHDQSLTAWQFLTAQADDSGITDNPHFPALEAETRELEPESYEVAKQVFRVIAFLGVWALVLLICWGFWHAITGFMQR